MRISYLRINTYKSIQEPFVLEHPGSLHLFIGSNNAGKTTLLDAIEQLSLPVGTQDIDLQADMSVRYTLSGKQERQLEVTQQKGTRSFFLDGHPLEASTGEAILQKHTIRLCATSPIPDARLREDFEVFKKEFSEAYRQFVSSLARYIPQIRLTDTFIIEKQPGYDTRTDSLYALGAGVQQVFVILLYLFHPQYTVVLLEEPEIHLHPALIKRLLRVIESENRYNQLFITTHSPLFIHTMNLHRLFRVTKGRGSTKVFSPRLVGKELDYRRLTQELNADNTEMFFADKVLLVEGPSDHILMRGLIDRFYVGVNDVKVIQTYGKSNVDVYAELLEIFHIPYEILLDRDALYDTGIHLLQKHGKVRSFRSEESLRSKLKRNGIFILPNGSIESNYPRKYQIGRKHKPQNALLAASAITQEEFSSPEMKHLKEVVDSL